ncbi:HalOD1 output domain-containing protein [Halorubellus salinus]|uniref:HalOD1 output domain-containing protein n=1 Tax=Halorubellus salinus TaxID=755309 RepID=UPI001D0775DC
MAVPFQKVALDDLTYHEHDGTYHGHLNPGCRSTSVAVTEIVSAVTNTTQTDLTPLFDAVDPDALDALCAPRDRQRTRPVVRFEYEGFEVTVRDCDCIVLRRGIDHDT